MSLFRLPLSSLGLATALLIASIGAQAAPWTEAVSQHPAMVPPQVMPALDVRIHLIGHPASPTTRGSVPNHRDHPAVDIARRARAGEEAVDPNTFLVQPPASTHWTLGPAPQTEVALLSR